MSLEREAIRLERTGWKDKEDLLADELFLILQGDRDPAFNPLTVNITSDDQAATFTPQPYNPSTDPPPASFPSLYWPEFTPEPLTQRPGGNGPGFSTLQRVKKSFVRTMLPAKVVSKQGGDGGDAATYTLDLYPDGSAEKPTQVDKATLLGSGSVPAGAWVSVYRFTELELVQDVRVPKGPLQSSAAGAAGGSDGIPQSFVNVVPAGAGSAAGEQVVSVRAKVKKRTHEIMPAGNSTFPAEVTGGGPGDQYTVDVFTEGLDKDPDAQDATQLQIADDDTIPVGTRCFVVNVGGVNYMQVPVWSAPAESA